MTSASFLHRFEIDGFRRGPAGTLEECSFAPAPHRSTTRSSPPYAVATPTSTWWSCPRRPGATRPASAPPSPPSPPTHRPAAALERVEAVTRHWWALLAERHPFCEEVGSEPQAGFRFGPDESQVRATARVTTRLAGGEAALADLRDGLADDGWAVDRAPGDVPRITAALDGLLLTASHAPVSGAFLLAVSSDAVTVGVVTARGLVAGDADSQDGL